MVFLKQIHQRGGQTHRVFGIAKRFHSALGSEYLAGLWQDNLPIELIWRVSLAESDTVRRPSKQHVPSWVMGFRRYADHQQVLRLRTSFRHSRHRQPYRSSFIRPFQPDNA